MRPRPVALPPAAPHALARARLARAAGAALLAAAARPADAPAQGAATPPAPPLRVASAARPTLPAPARAQGAGDARTLRAAAPAGGVRVDGRLDETAWAAATPATDFVTQWPKDRVPASQRTEVRVLVDGGALYVGARMYDTRPDSIAAQLARRDARGIYSDWLNVAIDSYHDRRTAFAFAVNPRGVQKDARIFDDTSEDPLWDAVWESATRVDSLGWTAELRIPLGQLRYAGVDSTGGRTWGVQFSRDVARLQERSNWAPIAQNANGFVSRFGDLAGLDALPAPRALEVQPYVSSRLTRKPGTPGDPFWRANAVAPSVGGDFRVGVGRGLTLTGTINPDFGQVELDPAMVNLTAFEPFFPERRPFFVEGADIFRFGRLTASSTTGAADLFYSRRIGRAPQRSAWSADAFGRTPQFVDAPTETPIRAAVKLSGKTAGGWSIGVLDAVSAGVDADIQQAIRTASDPDGALVVRRATPIAPPTNTFVGRARRDFLGGRTVVGGMLTHVARDLGAVDRPWDAASGGFVDGSEVFRPLLPQSALAGGVDFEHAWANRRWAVSGYALGTRASGSRQAISALQRAPYRLFQRPDGARTVDTTATALDGHLLGLALAKQGGRLTSSIAYQEYGAGLEVNDAGFGLSADRRGLSTFVGWNQNAPTRRLRQWNVFQWASAGNNLQGNATHRTLGYGASAQLHSLWTVGVTGNWYGPAYSDRLLRGGPLARTPTRWTMTPTLTTDPRAPIVVSPSLEIGGGSAGRTSRTLAATVSARPRANVAVSVAPSFARTFEVDQYVQREVDASATATYGARYVFADVRQTVLSTTARLNWTYTPRLSLELVAQPFVAAGRFTNYKEFARPRAFDFVRYGADGASTLTPLAAADGGGWRADPDGPTGPAAAFRIGEQSFTSRSLRGSAVLRWEWRPGSTLFFVWQQQRAAALADGRFVGERDLGRLWRDPAQNVFLVKASYWLAR